MFGAQILPLAEDGQLGYTPITIFILAPGAFFVLACLVATMNVIRKRAEEKGKPLPAAQGCLAGDCSGCTSSGSCHGHLFTKSGILNIKNDTIYVSNTIHNISILLSNFTNTNKY